jgi:hypothetical protein
MFRVSRFVFPIAALASITFLPVACTDDDPAPAIPDAATPGLDGSRPDGGSGDGSTPDVSTSDTSVAETSVNDGGEDASDGATDAAVTPQPTDIFVNAATGADTNSGNQGQPFKTITKAISVATAGKNVWLEDGTWDAVVDPPLGATNAAGPCNGTGVALPAGVNLRAINAGGAKVVLTGNYGVCLNGNVLRGIVFERASGGGYPVAAISGASSLEGVSFVGAVAGFSYSMMTVQSGAKVTMSPGALTRYMTKIGQGIEVTGNGSELVVNGGAFDDVNSSIISGAATVMVSLGGKAVLNGVLVERPVANQTASVIIGLTVNDGTMELRGDTVVKGFNNGNGLRVAGGATVLVTDNTVIRDNANGIFATSSTPLTNVTINGNAQIRNHTQDGIRGDFISGHNLALVVGGSAQITENGESGIEYSAGTFTMTGGSITNNGQHGATLLTALTALSIRNATITGNGWHGLDINGTGTCDLGTAASPGNNVISGNGAAYAGLNAQRTGITAVGNTWNASAQGADAQGKYALADGGTLEATGPVAVGSNYRIPIAGHKLKLAGP